MKKVDLQEFENCLENSVYGYVMHNLPKLIAELKSLRSENEAIKKDFKALFESRGNDYNNRIAALEDEIDKLEKVAEAARPLVRVLELCQVCNQDEDLDKAFKNEIVLQRALKELDGENVE